MVFKDTEKKMFASSCIFLSAMIEYYRYSAYQSGGALKMLIDGYEVRQILLPRDDDTDSHPRLLFNGYGIHAGEVFKAFLPDFGWTDITLEVAWEPTGPKCWYIPGHPDISPIGLFCRI